MISRKVWINSLVTLAILAVVYIFSGCAGKPEPVPERAPESFPVPESSLEELTVPQFQEEEPARLAVGSPGKLYSLRVREAQIQDVLLALAQESGENLVVDPEVTGTVTVNLNRVTLEQALEAILGQLGFSYRREGRIIRISKPVLETRIFSVNYISTSRKGDKTIVATHGSGAGGEQISASETRIAGKDEMDFWAEIQEGLTAIIFSDERPSAVLRARQSGVVSSLTSQDGKKLVISKVGGLIQVRDYPEKLREVARFLEQMEVSSQRQVLIQARFLEVTLRKEFETGIRWDNIQEQFFNLDLTELSLSWNLFGGGTSTSAKGALLVAGATEPLAGGDFVLADLVKALETQGKLKALASPKIATMNNQTAIVKVARQDVYFTSEISQGEVSTLQSFTPNTIDVGVILDVTPQIGSGGNITMNIHPSITAEFDRVTAPDGSEFPLLSIREADTVVKVRDGQTIIIAGLIEEAERKERIGLPCLTNLPVLSYLFGYRREETEKRELVILITPTVLTGKRIEEIKAEDLRRIDLLEQQDRIPIDYLNP
ncbi:MAG: secretin and TonB N-terminal domain-containing protein [Deltaproteobacteria bacterium]|nr:MAG: secretin and TonB N-terminal domain-containing protein [Deltaproteobacteria bacterium]